MASSSRERSGRDCLTIVAYSKPHGTAEARTDANSGCPMQRGFLLPLSPKHGFTPERKVVELLQ